jgi:hypothetical protein
MRFGRDMTAEGRASWTEKSSIWSENGCVFTGTPRFAAQKANVGHVMPRQEKSFTASCCDNQSEALTRLERHATPTKSVRLQANPLRHRERNSLTLHLLLPSN